MLRQTASAVLFLAAALIGGANDVQGQTGEGSRASLLVGVGPNFGWYGGQGELYLQPWLATYVGAGYTPGDDPLAARGATFSFGMRTYIGGQHRFVAEAGLSQVRVREPLIVARNDEILRSRPGNRDYGLGAQIGYSWVSGGGFTTLISGGIGYPLQGVDRGSYEVLVGLGVGYTWRR